MKKFLIATACVAVLMPGIASAQTVKDKKSCLRAVQDAREAVAAGTVSEKMRAEAANLVQIADHLCTQANFVFAENALQVARGMVAEE